MREAIIAHDGSEPASAAGGRCVSAYEVGGRFVSAYLGARSTLERAPSSPPVVWWCPACWWGPFRVYARRKCVPRLPAQPRRVGIDAFIAMIHGSPLAAQDPRSASHSKQHSGARHVVGRTSPVSQVAITQKACALGSRCTLKKRLARSPWAMRVARHCALRTPLLLLLLSTPTRGFHGRAWGEQHSLSKAG